MERKISLIFLCMALCGCTEHYFSEQVKVIELGATKKIITLPDIEPGSDAFTIISNCDWDYKLLSGDEWLSIGSKSASSLMFNFKGNNGYERSSKIIVFKDNRCDSLQVRQRGIITHSVNVRPFTEVVPAEGGSYSVIVETNFPEREISVYTDAPEQFSDIHYSGHRLYFTVKPAVERDKKSYRLTACSLNGWDEIVESSISVTQKAKSE